MYKGPRTQRRGRRESNTDDVEIPYQEANIEIGEIPLPEIDTFVIPARDEKGAFSRITMHIPPYLLQGAQVLMKSNRFPYLTEQDLFRHAIARHIPWLVSIRESVPKALSSSLEAMNELCRASDFRIRVHEAFAELDRQVSLCMNRGETVEAVRLLNIVMSRLDGVPPSPQTAEVKARLIERIEEFGYKLVNGRFVKVVDK